MPAAMADDSVQPVPCVLRVSKRGPREARHAVRLDQKIDALRRRRGRPSSARPWRRARAAARPARASRLRRRRSGRSSSAAASGRFGVTTSAFGISSRRRLSTASGLSSRSPEVATITGSSTTLLCLWRARPSATAAITAAFDSMPSLHRADLEIGEHRVDLRRDEIRRHVVDAGDALGVLRGERGDHRGAVDAERRKRLEIGLDARAAAGVRSRDGDGDGRHFFARLRQRRIDDAQQLRRCGLRDPWPATARKSPRRRRRRPRSPARHSPR